MNDPKRKPLVLFVCRHNTGRSQMAEAFLRRFAGDAVEVASAGTIAADRPNATVVAAMAEALGLEPATHQMALPHLIDSSKPRENLVLIHPGASRETKRWPVENWARLADAMAAQPFACPIALTGDRRTRAPGRINDASDTGTYRK